MLEDIAIYFSIGIVAGIIAGMLGIGSGVIVVPALVFVFSREHFTPNIIMHIAAGTSLATIAVTTSRALIGHLKRKVPVWPIYKRIFLGVILGTISGAVLAHFLHSHTLSIIFGIVLALLGLKMFFPSTKESGRTLPGTLGCSSVGFLIGGKSGLLGLGGGALSTPFFTHYGVPIRQSFAVATAVSVTVSVVGAISFIITGMYADQLPNWSTGYIYWPAWVGIIAGSLSSVPLGVWLSHRLPVALLRRVFAALLMLLGLHMLYVIWG